MTTPGRRILALLSLLALLLGQAGSASALCTCETPCAMGDPAETPSSQSASCCAEPAPPSMASLEGECCMADGPSVELSTAVALPAAPATEQGTAGVDLVPPGRVQASPEPIAAAALEPRGSPPSPRPLFLLTSSFLY